MSGQKIIEGMKEALAYADEDIRAADTLAVWCRRCRSVCEYGCDCPGGSPQWPLVTKAEVESVGQAETGENQGDWRKTPWWLRMFGKPAWMRDCYAHGMVGGGWDAWEFSSRDPDGEEYAA